MARLLAEDGSEPKVGESNGFWLSEVDFVSSTSKVAPTLRDLEKLGFPRDWPAVYTQSAALKALIGRRGRLLGKKVAVAGVPTPEEWAQVPQLSYCPLQSLANAERAAAAGQGLQVVRGWALFERLDRDPGEAFVAERYWWVALSDGRWVDVSPRPLAWPQLLLAESTGAGAVPGEAAGSAGPRRRSRLTAAEAEFNKALLRLRFGDGGAVPSSPPAASAVAALASATTSAAQSAKATTPAATAPTVQAPTSAQVAAAVAPVGRSVPAPQRLDAAAAGATGGGGAKLEPPTTDAKASPVKSAGGGVAAGGRKGLDYSKFDNIEDSDDERLVPRQEAVTLPMGMPREAVSREEYDKVWKMLLGTKELPFTPAPDLDQLWGYYKYGAMDEQALLDQACEYLGKFPCRLEPADYKAKTYTLTKKLEVEGREDEARMWSVICMLRFPKDPDAYYNQGVLLNKMCDAAKFGGAPTMRLPSLDGSGKLVPVEQYCSLFSRSATSYYRRCLKVDPKQRPGYINLIGCLERNEPSGWYEDVQQIAASAVKNGIWYNRWQRPPHFVPTLEAKPWHDPDNFLMCRMLEANYDIIRGEYDAYIHRLENRKDWDDSDTTPGLGDVGGRAGALHDGGLTKSGRWREVPLFTNCTLQREHAEYFPETIRILQTHCRDAIGISLCGGGDVIFSVLTPGTRLRPHCGPSNSRLTCHMGIRVPRTKEQGCYLRVAGEERRGWDEGKCVVFDDSFEHEVFFDAGKPEDPYTGDRVVLLANFWHPDFEFKNDPEWRQKSDEVIASVDVESLPQTAVMKVPDVASARS